MDAGRSFLIREARPSDGAALLPLWREIEALHAALAPGFFRIVQGTGRDGERAFPAASEVVLIAEAEAGVPQGGGRVCGLVHVRLYETPRSALLVSRRRAYVEGLVVAPWARRKGCGTLLMAGAAAWARERHAVQMVLTVWEGNEGAEAFYRSLGYRTVSSVLGLEI